MFHIELLNFVIISENTLAIQPYGPKMCSKMCSLICQNHLNCTSYVFNEVHLECQLVFNTTFRKRSSEERDNEDGTLKQGTRDLSCSQDEDTDTVTKPGCDEGYVEELHEACADGDMEEVKSHVCQGMVDVNCRDEEEKTAVMFAVEEGKENILDFLVKQNAYLSARDENEYTALHYACENGNINIVRKLVDDFKMDIEARNDDELTPLFLAVYSGHIQVVKFLIERGADVEKTNDFKGNILMEAIMGNHIDMVKYVLSLNVSCIDSRDQDGETPIMYAKKKRNKQIAKLLRNRGSNV